MKRLTAALALLLLAGPALGGSYHNDKYRYEIPVPEGWTAKEEKGPEQVVLRCEKSPSLRITITAAPRPHPLGASDAEQLAAKEEEALKKKVGEAKRGPQYPPVSGTLSQFPFTFSYLDKSSGKPVIRLSHVFGMEVLKEGALSPQVLDELKKAHYLSGVPDDPGAAPGTTGNYYLVTPGRKPVVACRVHGSLSQIKP